jgi:hypothetical protein
VYHEKYWIDQKNKLTIIYKHHTIKDLLFLNHKEIVVNKQDYYWVYVPIDKQEVNSVQIICWNILKWNSVDNI